MSVVEPQLSGASVCLPLVASLLAIVRSSLDVPMQTEWTCLWKSFKAASPMGSTPAFMTICWGRTVQALLEDMLWFEVPWTNINT